MASPAATLNAGKSGKVRFGLVADAHFAQTETLWARYYIMRHPGSIN